MTTNIPDTTEKAPEVQQKQEEMPPIKTEQNKANWQKYREERENDRKARKEAEERASKAKQEAEAIRLAMEALLVKPEPQQQQTQESEEARIERKVSEALSREKHKIEAQRKQEEAASFRKEYKDFDKVCSAENLDYLEYHHPEIAFPFTKLHDEDLDKWKGLYQAVKKHVPYENRKEEKSISRNLSKPQAHSPNMTDTKPLSSNSSLSEERKKENWKRMQRELKSFN